MPIVTSEWYSKHNFLWIIPGYGSLYLKCNVRWLNVEGGRWTKTQYQNQEISSSWICDKAQYPKTDNKPFISANIQIQWQSSYFSQTIIIALLL